MWVTATCVEENFGYVQPHSNLVASSNSTSSRWFRTVRVYFVMIDITDDLISRTVCIAYKQQQQHHVAVSGNHIWLPQFIWKHAREARLRDAEVTRVFIMSTLLCQKVINACVPYVMYVEQASTNVWWLCELCSSNGIRWNNFVLKSCYQMSIGIEVIERSR